jgi:hypothetical protein
MVRERGLLPTTKRGLGAAEMGGKEVAVLLIALHAANAPTTAAKAVQEFYSLCWEDWRGVHGPVPEPWKSHFEGKSFGEAFGTLLEILPRVVTSMLQVATEDGLPMEEAAVALRADPTWLRVTMNRPLLSAEIRFGQRRPPMFLGSWRQSEPSPNGRRELFMTSSVDILPPTFLHLSRAIHPEAWAARPLALVTQAYEHS